MPRQGGQGKGKPKLADKHFGKALIKRQAMGDQGLNGIKPQAAPNMISILDNSALDDFIITAEMDDEEADVHRVHQNDVFLVEPSTHKQKLNIGNYSMQQLVIPRKPTWDRTMTAEDVDRRERESFLVWRRSIAAAEEESNYTRKVTPFEKNLEVWRQLWRVIERSDMIVQIVDSRNPLMYYTHDLMKYANEQNPPKMMMLLLNKADFLTEYQRSVWANYLHNEGIRFVFYSAFDEQAIIDDLTHAGQDLPKELDPDAMEEVNILGDDLVEQWNKSQSYGREQADQHSSTSDKSISLSKRVRVLNRRELIALLAGIPIKLNITPQERHNGRVCVGMVGYPNVGKSSVINTLLGVSKSTHGVVRVAVSSTPGKTKHFQTLMISESLMLCDCPGLVFPSFMKSTGEMLCSGILPINQMRDYAEPANIIASRVPMHLLDAAYGMKIVRNLDFKDDPDRPATSSEVLEAYCKLKGYITNGTGRWDEFRACKELLRDFNDGRILAVVPPSMAMIDSKRWLAETEKTMMRNERVAERLLSHRPDELTPSVRKVGIKNDESEEFESGEMVFNFVPSNASTKNNTIASDHTVEEDRYEIVDDSDDDLSEGHSVANSRSMQSDQRVTREHKRMKHWGKKNKKLRNKNPYGDDNGAISYVAYSTNRQYKPQTANAILASDKSVLSGVASTSSAYGGLSKRQANRQQVDTLFTRAVLPHHQQK